MIIHADLPVDVGIKDDEEDNGVDNMIDEADFPVDVGTENDKRVTGKEEEKINKYQ